MQILRFFNNKPSRAANPGRKVEDMKFTKIEQHLYEKKNHQVKIEYHCYIDGFTYTIKTKLPQSAEKQEVKQIFHF